MKKHVSGGGVPKQKYWEEVVRRWQESGKSVRAFCRAEGLRESTFYFWRQKRTRRRHCDRRQAGAASPSAAFLPIKLVRDDPPEAPPGIEIVLAHGRVVWPKRLLRDPNQTKSSRSSWGRNAVVGGDVGLDGRVVRVQAGFDRQALAAVLAILEGRPC